MRSKYKEIVSKRYREISEDYETTIGFSNKEDNGKGFTILLRSAPCWKRTKDKKPCAVYFKVYISHMLKSIYAENFCIRRSTEMYRISMYDAMYIFAGNGATDSMTGEEIAEMVRIITMPGVWDKAIDGINNMHELDGTGLGNSKIHWKPIPKDLPMPDYSQLYVRAPGIPIEYDIPVSKELVEIDEGLGSWMVDVKNEKFKLRIDDSPCWKFNEDGSPYAVYLKIFISYRSKSKYTEFMHLKTTMIYRVSIYEPKYIVPSDDGTDRYLSKKELATVIDILKAPGVWSNVITGLNWEHHWDSKENKITCIPWKPIPENLPMPNYAKLPTRD